MRIAEILSMDVEPDGVAFDADSIRVESIRPEEEYAGLRATSKVEASIVDYVDREVPMLARMFERRRTGYRSIGYREAASVSPTVLR